MWANGERDEALRYLQKFSLDLTEIIRRSTVIRGPEQLPLHVEEAYQKLLARCFLKSGQWQMELNPAWAEVCRQLLPDSVARTEFAIKDSAEILVSFEQATRYDPTWYKSWHTWALANVDVIGHIEDHEQRIEDAIPETVAEYTVAAIEGLLRSISLGEQNSLQDTLRLLTLWFKFGSHDDVSHAVAGGFSMVSVDTWLEVIPQVRQT